MPPDAPDADPGAIIEAATPTGVGPATPAAPGSLGRLATRGGVSLIGRQAVSFGVSTVGGILLARLLSPSEFGAYAYILFAQALAKLLVDGGLTSTLVRQHEPPEQHDWRTVFTVQIGLAVVLACVVAASTPLVGPLFGSVGGFATANLLASVSVLVSPILSICFARLERELRFDRIAVLTLVQPLVFNVLAPLLAVTGIGVVALGLALLLSSIATLLVALPWTGRPPVPTTHLRGLRARLMFGAPYVGSGLISNLKDSVNPLLVGAVVGAAAVGYVRWGQQVAALATYLVAAVAPMLFALFSRLQKDPARLSKMVGGAVFWSNAITAPLALLLVLFIDPITTDLYGSQWVPAIPLFYLLCFTNLISPTTSALLALMNAIGRPGVALAFTIAWFVGTWVLVPVFVVPFGAIGYGIANAVIQLIGVVLVVIARRAVPYPAVRSIALPWLIAAIACLPAYLFSRDGRVDDLLSIAAIGLGSLLLYAALLRLIARSEARLLLTMLRKEPA